MSLAYQAYHYSVMLLCSPVSVSLCLHLLALSDLLFFSTSAPQPSFTVSVMHLCSLLLLRFMLSIPCPFYTPFLFCAFQLLHSASFYTPESLSIAATISSLFHIFILSVHLLCPPCTMPLHALHHATVLLIGLFTATPLLLCFARSSLKKKTTSRFYLFLIYYLSLSFI